MSTYLTNQSVKAQSVRVGPTEYPQELPFVSSGYVIIDKVDVNSDASVVFRSAGNSKGEIGIPADDDLHIKTVTGTWGVDEVFTDAIICKNTTADVYIPFKLGVGQEPVEQFHVSANNPSARTAIRFDNANTSTGSRSVACSFFGGDTLTWTVGIDAGLTGANNFFLKDEKATSNHERIFVNGSGQVGLSNTNPQATLDVAGSTRVRPVVLTDGANIVTDASLSDQFRVTLGGNRTLDNPLNPLDGQKIMWEIIQDATGGRTLTLGNAFAFGADIPGPYVPSADPSKRDFLGAIYNAAAGKYFIIALSKGY